MENRLFSFWSGKLSYIEKLCLTSMVRAGHTVDVYTYDDDLDLPCGLVALPASQIIEKKHVIRHANGSLALFSDIFRYVGLQKNAGIWIDLDVLLLRPLTDLDEYIFGWQDDFTINGAVLKLPPDSVVLNELLELARAPTVVAPYWRRRDKLKQIVRGMLGCAVPLSRLEWGIIGPNALSYYLKAEKLDAKALPREAFYPIPYKQAADFFNRDAADVEAQLKPHTRAVHIWNDIIKELKKKPPPRGSFIEKQCQRFGIAANGALLEA